MGILNVTPDSFSGDGLLAHGDPVTAAVDQARRMVDAEAELARVVPVVAAVRRALPDLPISVDTAKAPVAEAALEAGADLLNDVTGTDPRSPLAAIAAARGVPLIVMHGRREGPFRDVVGEVLADLTAALSRAEAAGVAPEHLVVDPGIGFGKTPSENLALLHDLARLGELGRPVLLGTSRKSTIGRVLDLPADERLEGTLATTALGVAAGVDVVRVHDVAANVRAARMADAIVRGWTDPDVAR
jgi:dihydropteroate synthase